MTLVLTADSASELFTRACHAVLTAGHPAARPADHRGTRRKPDADEPAPETGGRSSCPGHQLKGSGADPFSSYWAAESLRWVLIAAVLTELGVSDAAKRFTDDSAYQICRDHTQAATNWRIPCHYLLEDSRPARAPAAGCRYM